jgi:hypothetical protein
LGRPVGKFEIPAPGTVVRIKASPVREPGPVSGLRPEAFDPALQDHLFISFAWKNYAFADWLVRQLRFHGYRVWCDRFQMLGGEPFPKIIDQAGDQIQGRHGFGLGLTQTYLEHGGHSAKT